MKSEISLLAVLSLATTLSAADFVILETDPGAETRVIAGDASLADQEVTPASTFKIVITWAALEQGLVEPATRHRCEDAHVPGTPRKLSLAEAMYFSSNEYFDWLAERIGRKKLTSYLERSGFFPKPAPATWLTGDLAGAVHGGDLKVSARQQHRFIQRVMEGQLASSPAVQANLLECMVWPSGRPQIALYGKTGSWSGVAWFNGFGCQDSKWKAVTVLMLGKGAVRGEAIRHFYEQWGLKPPGKS